MPQLFHTCGPNEAMVVSGSNLYTIILKKYNIICNIIYF